MNRLLTETRAFYEDFLGLRMVSAFEMNEGRALLMRDLVKVVAGGDYLYRAV
jgi:catechol 2,3-dioxygenase-like lactoylglutathione lyase family enzyme